MGVPHSVPLWFSRRACWPKTSWSCDEVHSLIQQPHVWPSDVRWDENGALSLITRKVLYCIVLVVYGVVNDEMNVHWIYLFLDVADYISVRSSTLSLWRPRQDVSQSNATHRMHPGTSSSQFQIGRLPVPLIALARLLIRLLIPQPVGGHITVKLSVCRLSFRRAEPVSELVQHTINHQSFSFSLYLYLFRRGG